MTAKSRDPARAGSHAAEGLGEDRVGAYLLEHPDFLVRHPHVLKAMTVPSRASGDGVVDMQHFMLERLREEIGDLRDCAQDVIETSRYNMSVQTRTHAAVLALLAARTLGMAGQGSDAIAAAGAAVEAHPENPAVAAGRALLLGELGRVSEALAAAGSARTRFPEAASVAAAEGAIAYLAGDAARGDAATARALALDPGDPTPLRKRCEFRASTHAWKSAREACEAYLQARPDDGDVTFVYGVVLTGSGDSAGAIAALRRAAELDPKDFRPPNNLAELLAAEGDTASALEAAQRAYRLSDGHPAVADTVGTLYLRRGLVDRAISFLEEARAGAPGLPDAGLHLAEAYAAAGRKDEAEAVLAAMRTTHAADAAVLARIEETSRALR